MIMIRDILQKPAITVEELALITNYARSYIYQLIYHKRIPYCKRGKRVMFLTEEVMKWYKGERQLTEVEQAQNAADNILNYGKR